MAALFPRVGRTQPRLRIAWWALVAFLCLGVLLHLAPFYYMIMTSFKSGAETLADPPTLWPHHFTLEAWKLVFNLTNAGSGLMDEPFYVYLLNSLFIAALTLLLSLPITSLAAYANSKLQRGPVARWSFLFFIGTLMVPFATVLLPTLLLVRHFPFAWTIGPGTAFPTMQIWNTPWAAIIPGVFNAFNFLLFKGFFDTIPTSIIQAARVDGGSELNIFRRIILPMSIPVYAVAAWLQFGGVWDSSFLWQSLALQSSDKITTAVAIYNLSNRLIEAGTTDASQALGQSMGMQQILNAGLTWNGLMVLGLLQTIPIFIAFIICREYLLRGIRIRGLR